MGKWADIWFGKRPEQRSLTLEQLIAEDQTNTTAGSTVNTETAQRLSAVWGCIRVLVDVISTMPCHAYADGSRDPVNPAPIMLRSPAAGVPFHDWVAQVMRSLLLTGNAWGIITNRIGPGLRPSQVELVAPHRVTVTIDGDGNVVHRLDGREIDRDDLWHLRAYVSPGSLLGLSPIAYAAETIGVGLAAQQYGAAYFRDSTTPSGYLTGDQLITQTQADELLARWEARHKNRKGTAVLGKGMEFKPVMVAPDESQFLDTQRLTVQQVCRIYGVPPELLAADSGNSLTYANVEQRDLSLLKYTVDPWLVRLETALTDLVPRGEFVKFNRGSLLRADTLTRYQAHQIGISAGFLTVNEARELEDREPLPAATRPQISAVA